MGRALSPLKLATLLPSPHPQSSTFTPLIHPPFAMAVLKSSEFISILRAVSLTLRRESWRVLRVLRVLFIECRYTYGNHKMSPALPPSQRRDATQRFIPISIRAWRGIYLLYYVYHCLCQDVMASKKWIHLTQGAAVGLRMSPQTEWVYMELWNVYKAAAAAVRLKNKKTLCRP